ncbi:hypothetical protein ScalyP_jg2259 [Parmales sp. scaly parma]|nr:hypothetical protein ScalyP_jg2259 [Parmales sp. scaly parma]
MSFHEDPRRKLPIELQGSFSVDEAYDLLHKFAHYDSDDSGCIDSEELKLILKDYDADPATVTKLMGAIDANRNGQIEFDEFASLISRMKRYKMEQLLPMQAMKGAVSSDAPTMFKTRGCAVLDRTLGPNFPVRYTPNPRYKVLTPPEPIEQRALDLRARQGMKGTAVSYQTPAEFKMPGIQVEPETKFQKYMTPDPNIGWGQKEWKTPFNTPQSYMVPASVEPENFTTTISDRKYGTVHGAYPPGGGGTHHK